MSKYRIDIWYECVYVRKLSRYILPVVVIVFVYRLILEHRYLDIEKIVRAILTRNWGLR